MKANDLRRAMHKSSSMRELFLHFAQAFMVQTAHTAVANGARQRRATPRALAPDGA